MKKIWKYKLMLILSIAILNITTIWAVVEFILYLAIDSPFNWYSVAVTVLSFMSGILFYLKILSEIDKENERFKREINEIPRIRFN